MDLPAIAVAAKISFLLRLADRCHSDRRAYVSYRVCHSAFALFPLDIDYVPEPLRSECTAELATLRDSALASFADFFRYARDLSDRIAQCDSAVFLQPEFSPIIENLRESVRAARALFDYPVHIDTAAAQFKEDIGTNLDFMIKTFGLIAHDTFNLMDPVLKEAANSGEIINIDE